jgi:tetratricopeptide (TPR) repeat protein
LAQNPLLNNTLQAHLWTVCGAVQLYHISTRDALIDLAEAEKRCPELPYLTLTRADLYRTDNDLPKSKEALDAHLKKHPKDPEAHVALGRYFAALQQPEEALRCYENAIAADPGNTAGYRQKIGWWGSTEELYREHKHKIGPLVRRVDAIEPENSPAMLLEAFYACAGGKDFEAAQAWLDESLRADPRRLETVIAAGYLQQAQQRYDAAAARFEEAVQLAPNALDGYWNMAFMRIEQEKHLDAAAWFEKALEPCPLFRRTLWVRTAEACMAAGELARAQESCFKALALDPDFDYAVNTLYEISDKLRNKGFDEKTGPKPALEVLRQIRAIKGESNESGFQNRCGNVYYYFNDFAAAIEAYQKAAALEPQEAVYHDNLAGALENLAGQERSEALYAAALESAETAQNLAPETEAYRQKAARIRKKRVPLRHFGVPAEERSADLASIRVRFREDLMPHLVVGDNLAPALLESVEALRARLGRLYGFNIPGVRFSTDWNIAADANFVIDFDGIPMFQSWFDPEKNGIGTLIGDLEQQIRICLADFIRYDSPEIAARFVGKTPAYASGLFAVIRMLLKQKIAIADLETICAVYDAGLAENQSVQAIMERVRSHPRLRPELPLNLNGDRNLGHFTEAEEAEIMSQTVTTTSGQRLWPADPFSNVFNSIVNHVQEAEAAPGRYFVLSKNPTVATVLGDFYAGVFFGEAEAV